MAVESRTGGRGDRITSANSPPHTHTFRQRPNGRVFAEPDKTAINPTSLCSFMLAATIGFINLVSQSEVELIVVVGDE